MTCSHRWEGCPTDAFMRASEKGQVRFERGVVPFRGPLPQTTPQPGPSFGPGWKLERDLARQIKDWTMLFTGKITWLG